MRERQIVESENNNISGSPALSKIKNNDIKQVFYDLILKENREKNVS